MLHHFAYHFEPAEGSVFCNHDKKIIGTLARKVRSSDGDILYYVIACQNRHGIRYVPLPLAIIRAHNGNYIADIDRSAMQQAPEIADIATGGFDENFASRIDAAFGTDFPGVENINDFA